MINKLIKLIKENPKLPVKFFTHYDVTCEPSPDYWLGELEKVEIDYLWHAHETIYIGEDEIRDELAEILREDNKDLNDEDYENLIHKKSAEMIDKGEIIMSVIVYINV